jgi:hypothetical protein
MKPERKMVGRMAELSALQIAFHEMVERRRLRMVTVIGEAGIGKSRLLAEFQRWFQGLAECHASFLSGRAGAETVAQPFSLIRNVFRSQFGIQDSDPMSVAREKFESGFTALVGGREPSSQANTYRIGRLLGFDFSAHNDGADLLPESQQTRYQTFQNLSELFAKLGSTNGRGRSAFCGTLLLLDDLQWSDDDSLDLVTHLAKNYSDVPMMILTSARPALLERRLAWGEDVDNHVRLDLDPLSLRESGILVETLMSPER